MLGVVDTELLSGLQDVVGREGTKVGETQACEVVNVMSETTVHLGREIPVLVAERST